MTDVLTKLKSLSSLKNKAFTQKLVPDTRLEILGVCVPDIRNVAKQLAKNKVAAMRFFESEHLYYEEWFTHGLLIGYFSDDHEKTLNLCKEFVSHIDNWAICDSFTASVKQIDKDQDFYLQDILKFTESKQPYVVRAGVTFLLNHYLCDKYFDTIISAIKDIDSDNYYVNMGVAWLLSVMLVKFYERAIPLFINPIFKKTVHNKAIQKAVESRRIPQRQKQYLKKLKIK